VCLLEAAFSLLSVEITVYVDDSFAFVALTQKVNEHMAREGVHICRADPTVPHFDLQPHPLHSRNLES
jgi:hypothetical protein